MSALYLVRHGQASFGASNYDQLSECGQAQALRLGQYWAECGFQPDAVLCGSLERQKDTARILAEQLEKPVGIPVQDERFNEADHEAIAAQVIPVLAAQDQEVADFVAGRVDRRAVFESVFEKVVKAWISETSWSKGLETWTDFSLRVNTALEELMQQAESGSEWVVVTSGGPITAILTRLLKLDAPEAIAINGAITNASITKIQFNARGRRSLSYFNQHAYLQNGRDGSLITLR